MNWLPFLPRLFRPNRQALDNLARRSRRLEWCGDTDCPCTDGLMWPGDQRIADNDPGLRLIINQRKD